MIKWRGSTACLVAAAIGCVLLASADAPSPKLQDPLENPGFVAFFNNEYDEAIAYFSRQVAAHPNDPAQYNHLAQSILYQEMYRNGSLESQLVSGNNSFLRREKMTINPETRQKFNDCLTKSFALTAAALQQNPRDTQARYQQGSAHAMRATYFFLVEKAWIDSLKEASAARKLNEAVLEADPNFVDAHLILGVYSYVVGSLPFYMRAFGAVGGFHGDKAAGIEQLKLVATKGVLDKYDAQVLLAVLYRREHKARLAIPLLQNLAQLFPRNALFRFEQVQMYSDLGDKSAALSILNSIDHLQRSGAPGYGNLSPDKVRFVAGNLHFWYNDLPLALENFKQVTADARSLDLNSALLGWLRLGQIYDLQGNHNQAIPAYREAIKVAPDSQAASEAKNYISNPYRRKHNDG